MVLTNVHGTFFFSAVAQSLSHDTSTGEYADVIAGKRAQVELVVNDMIPED